MRNIIITGGELFNKGAEAMTFITVDELKKRFPNHKVYLLSDMDLKRPREERKKYAFSFMGWYPIKFAKCQSNWLLRLLCKLKNGSELKEAENIYKNTDLMVDISGYALGSNWSYEYINTYLEHLEFAKAFKIPVFLMSQSFGPFDFKGEKAEELHSRIQWLLPEMQAICAREKEGYEALVNTYHLNNVYLSQDIVLNNISINHQHIFVTVPQYDIPNIEGDAIGIIPNQRNFEVGNKETVYELYNGLINHELGLDHRVYLLSHSSQDAKICERLKQQFVNESNVIWLDQDFSSIEFNEIVKKFKYVIASRFHSVVHAYKNAIPCIVLGWATKYHDLTEMFGQKQYMVDVRDEIDAKKIISQIEYLNGNLEEEKVKILGCLCNIQKANIFDILTID